MWALRESPRAPKSRWQERERNRGALGATGRVWHMLEPGFGAWSGFNPKQREKGFGFCPLGTAQAEGSSRTFWCQEDGKELETKPRWTEQGGGSSWDIPRLPCLHPGGSIRPLEPAGNSPCPGSGRDTGPPGEGPGLSQAPLPIMPRFSGLWSSQTQTAALWAELGSSRNPSSLRAHTCGVSCRAGLGAADSQTAF